MTYDVVCVQPLLIHASLEKPSMTEVPDTSDDDVNSELPRRGSVRATFFIVAAAVQDPNRARRSAANALTTKSSAAAIASKLSRLLEEDKNIKQVTSVLCCDRYVGVGLGTYK
jgi:hypothetical protein